MRRTFPLILVLLLPFTAQAQFGPQHFAFVSDLDYPRLPMTGDLDGDGDTDMACFLSTAPSMVWFANDGTGHFGPRLPLAAITVGSNTPRKLVDVDGDGDADLVLNGNLYKNDGAGTLTYYASIPGGGALSMLFEDLDGDGDVDDVVRTTNSVVLLQNNGNGDFSSSIPIGPSGATTSLGVARMDMDGDSDLDLVFGGVNPQAGWYPNLGGGNYGVQHPIPDWGTAMPFVGDAEGDGDPDLLAFGTAPGVRWYATDGAGTLTLMDTLSTWTGLPTVLADLDGDLDVDWPIETGTNCNVHVVFNQSGTVATEGAVENFSGYNLVGTAYAAGDMDGDGRTDLVACHGLGIAMWYRNEGNGTISLRHELSRTLCGAYDVVAPDLDGDGDLDLVSASYYGDIVATYENLGNGTFGPQRVIVEHLDQVSGLFTGDVDNDGDPDLLTNRPATALLRNQGGGNWAMGPLPGNNIPRALVDLDGDHDLDIVCNAASWLANDGSGNFSVVDEPLFASAGKVLPGDVNGDGTMDLVFFSNPVHAFVNDGAGHFTDVASPLGQLYGDADLGDLDTDGDLDIATIQYAGTTQYWYVNDGTGLFTQAVEMTNVPNGGRAVLARDISGDGVPDLVWARSEGYTHRTYANLNNGDGTFGPLILVDPSAESTAKLILADVNGDAVEDLVEARFHTLAWQENHFFDRFRARGDVFKDYDQNGQRTANEPGLPFLPIRTSPAPEVLTWTNSFGGFDQPVDSGITYQLWPELSAVFGVTSTPAEATVLADANEPIVDSLLFGVAPSGPAHNVVLSVTHSPFRCDSDRDIDIALRNLGSFVPHGIRVHLELTGALTYLGSSLDPDSVVGPNIYWSLDSLVWFDVENIRAYVRTGAAGALGGYTVTVTAIDEPEPWTATGDAVFTCALDPNDKQVSPIGYGLAGAVPIDQDRLTYTIRFQNTGTDTALNVVLIDRLSEDLEHASMEVLGSSHPITRIQVDADGELEFRLERIMLPHEAVDAAGSNGYVTFRIKPRTGAPSGTEIHNTAEIYFDFNAPVITNTTLNTLIDCDLYTVAISSDDGSLLHASEGELFQWYRDGAPIPGADGPVLLAEGQGDYTVEATSIHGCVSTSAPYTIISTGIAEGPAFSMAAVPNPAMDHVRIVANTALLPTDRVELVDLNGQVLRVLRGSGSRELRIDRAGLAAGLYVVRLVREGSHLGLLRLAFH